MKPISDCKDEADAIYNDNVWQPRQNVVDPLDTVERFKSQPKYFWIDPLCVPLEPESTQKTAIASMRKVYNRANRVLVLDSDLMSTEIPQLSQSAMVCEEPVTRITMSNWSQRFWTLQEGVLANFLYFQFQNQAIWRPQLSELTDENEVEFCFDNEISYYSSDMDYSWRSGGLVNSRLLQIMQVWRSLARRVTSLPEDMPVCVATLLDISVEKILNVPKEERELKLWGEYGMVPAGVLMHIGPKFEDPRYCWAPRSLEECSRLPQPATVPLHITDDGCEVSLHGFQIDLPHETLPKAVIAFRFDNHVYYIRQNQKFGNKAWKGIDFARHKKLGIILAQIPPQDPDIRPPLVGALATMLSVVGEREDGALLVHYLRAVSVMKEGSQFDKYPNPAWLPEEIEEKKYVIDAIPKGVNQKWFIIPDA